MVRKLLSLTVCVVFFGVIVMSCSNSAETPNKPKEPVLPVPPSLPENVKLFPLDNVTLLDGPFKTAFDLNTETLLKYDMDRLIAPFRKEAGLPKEAELYTNWSGLDGHVTGHYLSALAITWATSKENEQIWDRMMYMLNKLQECQDKNGDGYVGGVPNGADLWNRFRKNDLSTYPGSYWVPWYNVHKMFAGLRDTWTYCEIEQGRDMFLKFCDWGVDVIAGLSDSNMERMLDTEFGGMNEVYIDAYEMTGDIKYLNAGKRFSHKSLLNSMASKVDNLNGQHANTQVPKVVGYAKVAKYTNDITYTTAAEYFWDRVVNYRSVAFGGNSRNERFRDPLENYLYMEWVQGPETCNTYNMLKLTETLFRISPQAKYADYYERALYNHILSSQNPQTGGYVYFTPLRPEHYRIYSTADVDMWCCVGTGMENHGKYGTFIYSHDNDNLDLYVNLFAPSRLSWSDKGVTLTQNTAFPDADTSKLTINVKSPTAFRLKIRRPWWIGGTGMKVQVNGEAKNYAADSKEDTYIEIYRMWKDGDRVDIKMPMDIYVEGIDNVSGVMAIMRGPILLSAEVDTESNLRMYGDGSRMGHEANGLQIATDKAPVIIGEPEEIIAKIKDMQPTGEGFVVPDLSSKGDVTLKPFFRLHDSRYIMYWVAMTQEEYDKLQSTEDPDTELANRTVDRVMPGEQQSEAGHNLRTSGYIGTGVMNGEYYRSTREGGWFEYVMDTQRDENLKLMVRYWGNEIGSRTFDIQIGGTRLVTENTSGKWKVDEFKNVEYEIPATMLQGKTSITVRFTTSGSNQTGGIYSIRLLR